VFLVSSNGVTCIFLGEYSLASCWGLFHGASVPIAVFNFTACRGCRETAKLSSHCKNDTEAASEATYNICHNKDLMPHGRRYWIQESHITKNNSAVCRFQSTTDRKQDAHWMRWKQKKVVWFMQHFIYIKSWSIRVVIKNSAQSALWLKVFLYCKDILGTKQHQEIFWISLTIRVSFTVRNVNIKVSELDWTFSV